MVEIPDTAGLICGFRLRAEGPAERFEDVGAALAERPVWLHFRLSDVRVQKWIQACERIPRRWREMMLDVDAPIRLETSEQGFAGALGDLRYEFNADPDRLGIMHIYADQDLVITARLHALQTVDQLRLEVRDGLPLGGTMALVNRFIEDVADTLTDVALAQGKVVDDIEDLVLKDRFLRESEDLGRVRRLLTRLRRHIDAQRHALSQVAHRPPAWVGEKDLGDLRRSVERLGVVSQEVQSIQERAHSLQDEIAARIGNATNQNLYIVSLLTAVFLPITLISGIFGMNVGGLPWEQTGSGFAWVLALMGLTVATSLALLHWRRFF